MIDNSKCFKTLERQICASIYWRTREPSHDHSRLSLTDISWIFAAIFIFIRFLNVIKRLVHI